MAGPAPARPVNVRLHLLRGVLSVLMLGSFIFAVRESSLATTYSIFTCALLLAAAPPRRSPASAW